MDSLSFEDRVVTFNENVDPLFARVLCVMKGTPVHVKEAMARFTTNVIVSCAFSINGNSLKDPDAEFGRYLHNKFHFTVENGLAMLTGLFAPYLKALLNLKFVDDKTLGMPYGVQWNTGRRMEWCEMTFWIA